MSVDEIIPWQVLLQNNPVDRQGEVGEGRMTFAGRGQRC